MNTYIISNKTERFAVNAANYNSAAQIAAKQLNKRRVSAQRTSGDHNRSGWFQSYYAGMPS